MLTLQKIKQTRIQLHGHIRQTPCRRADQISKISNSETWIKYENLQYTGSFKARGAIAKLLELTPEERERGVIAASAGNHAQGVAFHAERLGIKARIVMPVNTPLIKISRTKSYGATAILHGDDYDGALAEALRLSAETGEILIHAYDDLAIIAGQASIGLELIEQHPYIEVVVVPVGGGGMISGIAAALKAIKPSIRIIGVEIEKLESMKAAINHGAPVEVPKCSTLADGIAVRKVGQYCYDICKDLVDEWVCVTDEDIAKGLLYLLEQEKTVAEGAGAAAVAAVLSEKISNISGKEVVCLLGGGNIDVNVVSRIIERGLVESGRLAKLEIRTQDKPGVLASFLEKIACARANVVEIHHERAFASSVFGEIKITVMIETRGEEHIRDILKMLKNNCFKVERKEAVS